MKSAYVFAFLLFLGLAAAQQYISPGTFLYQNISVGHASQIVIALNATPSIGLMVIRASDLGAFVRGRPYATLYNSTVSSGIYVLNVSEGNYTILYESAQGADISEYAMQTKAGAGTIAANGTYLYVFSLSNYSEVNLSVASPSLLSENPVSINISGYTVLLNSNAHSESISLYLNKGGYLESVSSEHPVELFISTTNSSVISDPLKDISNESTFPIGVASYGLYNRSGVIVPYQIYTSQVIGVANITSIRAYSLNLSKNVPEGGASLQLNVETNTHFGGRQATYWLQNVAVFNTSDDTFYLSDNIWNNSMPYSNISSATLSGSGRVNSCSFCKGISFYSYRYPIKPVNYSLPFSIKLFTSENQTAGGTVINFGYQILENGYSGTAPINVYDRVLIPGSSNSSIVITPYYRTASNPSGGGEYYDAELVFAGAANGETAVFSSMNSSMWIYYEKNGTILPFPSAYTFGINTAEGASNIKVLPYKYGALAVIGKPDLSESILVSNSIASATQYVENTSRYTTVSTAIPSTTLNPIVLPPVSQPARYRIYAGLLVIIVAIVVLFVAVRRLHRIRIVRKQPGTKPPTNGY